MTASASQFTRGSLTRGFIILAACTTLAGCISYESHRENQSRPGPSPTQLAHIELGETHTDWLLEQFGDPTAVRRPSDTIRIWQYENLANQTTRVSAFPLFSVKLSDEVRRVYNFEIENQRIVKFWEDNP